MKIDLQTTLGVAGIALTMFFGVWSIVTGKVKAGSRFVKLFLVLLLLFAGQFVSAKWVPDSGSPSYYNEGIKMNAVMHPP